MRQLEVGTFDNFNIVVAGLKGSIAEGVGLIYETLATQAFDEVSTAYGLLAESVSHPEDRSYVIYRLRTAARWHDGKPVTPDDVIFSFDALKKNSPMYSAYYRHITKCEQVGEHDVKFTFDGPGNRELPLITGELMVFPKHWWEGTDSQGRKRDITATTLEIPLGSGPYRIKEFDAGRSLVLERVADYWGKDFPHNIGQNNFDQIRYEFFRDDTVAREAFKADQLDWILERSAKEWSTAYDFPAVREKRVLLEKFPIRSSGRMQGFAFNLRRPLFQDVRLRRAFNYVYDFEEMNRQLSTGEYSRDNSYFEGTELAIVRTAGRSGAADTRNHPRQGAAGGFHHALSESGQRQSGERARQPARSHAASERSGLRSEGSQARRSRRPARDGRISQPRPGRRAHHAVLQAEPGAAWRYRRTSEPSTTCSTRTACAISISISPPWCGANRCRRATSSAISSARSRRIVPGSRNLPGIKNPAIDTLIDRIIFAKDRAELVAASKAMDRVLLWNFYVVPQFTYGFQRYARWDRFSHPEPLPQYGVAGFPTLWWWDAEKAAKTGKRA